jgi:hypothetical protein
VTEEQQNTMQATRGLVDQEASFEKKGGGDDQRCMVQTRDGEKEGKEEETIRLRM